MPREGSARHDRLRGMSDSPGAAAELPNAELWLVDGYNALHAVLLGGGQSEERRQDWWRSEHRERLILSLIHI